MSTIKRDRWVDVLVEQREAQARLREVRDLLTPSARDIAGELLTLLGTNSRFNWQIRVKQLVDMIGYSRQTISAALNELNRLGVLAWKCGVANGKSFVALSQKYLPGDPEKTGQAPETGNVKPVLTSGDKPRFTPVREEQDEKNVREREPEPAPSLPAVLQGYEIVESSSGTEELLTPDEDHDEDARFAASTLAMHLFHGVPDSWTCQQMYRRFKALPIGSTTRVLETALLGRPARTIDYPNSYAAEWIRSAADEVLRRTTAHLPRTIDNMAGAA